MEFVLIGVTFDPRDAEYISGILIDSGMSGAAEGTASSGYWISVEKSQAVTAISQIQSNFRYREMDLNVALTEPSEVGMKWTQERFNRLIQQLPGPIYRSISQDSLDCWFKDRIEKEAQQAAPSNR